MKHLLSTGTVAFLATSALASDPASHDVTVPTQSDQVVTIEWTGTALPGAHGNSKPLEPDASDAFALLGNYCPPPVGADDAHAINLTVPEDAYGQVQVRFEFHIEWEEGTDVGGQVTVPDLVLTVYDDDGLTPLGTSDGGSPEENVSLSDLPPGTYTVVACPFLAATPTPYSGRLKMTASSASCAVPPSQAKAHAAPQTASALPWRAELAGLPNLDVSRAEFDAQLSPVPQRGYAGRYQSTLFDRSLGQPTFLWAERAMQASAVGPLANERDLLIARARRHLAHESKKLKLTPAMLREAEVVNAQFNGNGPAVVRFRQRVNGLEVHARYLNVLLDRSHKPIAVSGYFATDYDAALVASAPVMLSAPQAIAAAWQHLGGTLDVTKLSLRRTQGEYAWYAAPVLSGSHVFERDPRSRLVYFARAGRLEPAYYIELFAQARANGNLLAYALLVLAETGEILKRKNLKQHAAYEYRSFADTSAPWAPYDSPRGNTYAPFPGSSPDEELPRLSAASHIVSLEAGPISTGDPWLPEGATQTIGNNVEACIDNFDPVLSDTISHPLNLCTPEAGDEYGQTNGPNRFDYPLQADDDPSGDDARMAAVVNMFYIVNWLHDWWYDHGFDEASGNAQQDNYGRGGQDGDPIRAQGQDASGRNNANMATPSDGSSPTMQQYLFDGPIDGTVKVLTPVESGNLRFEGASWGPRDYDVTGSVVLADESMGPSPSDGCGPSDPVLGLVTAPALPPQADMFGKFALIDRGSCNFTTKAQYAVLSGASALIVVNNNAGAPGAMGNGDLLVGPGVTDPAYNLPSVMITKADGDQIKAYLAAGEEVTMHMTRKPATDLDGTLDNQIIAHEFYHYVHHRLTDSSSQQTGAMSEGWGDVSGVVLSVREDDVLIPGNADFSGAYGLAGYATHNYYSGIRRIPYSTDFDLNAYTFRHIAEGEPTPGGGAGTGNSAVHSAGEIWANMVWNCYAGLLNDPRHSFVQAQSRMKDYIIGSLKMTPADATYTEARDAMLAVALANDFTDYANCSAGFARRGAGLNARAPARSSADLVGVVEDFTPFICEKSLAAEAPAAPRVELQPTRGGALGWVLLLGLAGLAGGRCQSSASRRRRHLPF